ncbi:ATP-binding cassette sub-family A member 1 [Eurytemora carolleeae]|uniref:ATP-binding cassette sub-family A member 1 n=1 Tax=Eurytemora carolleeae TaxID=1294199 RepID=UPI000C7737B1|nr:ATP-binding cassette sub-family A member 1 [Eurytemora carolleeae]|eukprot:XP_023347550.1 ATP-binding cassette sub-family A member 1-like [Eurytemora affinis]
MCNDMIKTLEGSRGIQFLWSQVKPFIRGKILYTPDTPVTRRLVEVVNRTFQPLETIKLYLKNWTVSYSLVLQDFLLDPNNQESIKNFFTSPEGPFQYALQLGEEKNITLNQTDINNTLEKYFNGNFSDTWNSTLIKLDEFIKNVSNYLECFETEKFEAVSSEHALEKRGLELIATNQLWAGLVFPDITEDLMKLPRFVSYKIRIDADKVDSTKRIEDRLTMRGPRRRPGIDLKYLYFGFSYLQDLVERAIIHIHTGRNISSLPGIFMQQEPYPCYIEDRFILAIFFYI